MLRLNKYCHFPSSIETETVSLHFRKLELSISFHQDCCHIFLTPLSPTEWLTLMLFITQARLKISHFPDLILRLIWIVSYVRLSSPLIRGQEMKKEAETRDQRIKAMDFWTWTEGVPWYLPRPRLPHGHYQTHIRTYLGFGIPRPAWRPPKSNRPGIHRRTTLTVFFTGILDWN